MSTRVRGLWYIAVSAFCFAVMSVLAKIATDPEGLPADFPWRAALVRRPVSSFEAIFYRSLLGWLGLLAAARLAGARGTRENPRLLVQRGVLGGCAILCYFYAIEHTPVSKAALIGYGYPVFAIAFAWMFLGERLGARAAGLMAAALAGVALMLRPDPALGFNPGDAVALAGSVFSGGAVATLRRLRRSEEATVTVVLHFTFWSTLVSLPLVGLNVEARTWTVPAAPDLPHALLVAAIAAASVAGQLFLTSGYRHCRTSEGGTMSLLNAVFTVAFGVGLLGETLAWTTWAGGALTLAACGLLVSSNAATHKTD
jgi:drug/metabolite transporter (DMT)-like permease